MNTSQIVLTGLLAIFGGAGASIVAGYYARPKTKAEAKQINTLAGVSVSQDAREWAKTFAEQAQAAQERAQRAEERAEASEAKADAAEAHADALDTAYDHLESLMIQSYGYVRELQESVRQLGGTPKKPPRELEAMWEGREKKP